MSEREIEFKDIRVGDTIRREWMNGKVKWTAEAKILEIHGNVPYLKVDDGASWTDTIHKYTYFLLDRPQPPLPTEPGSVIIATRVRGVKGKWRMMLYPNGDWVSSGYIDDYSFHFPGSIQEWRLTEIFEVTE